MSVTSYAQTGEDLQIAYFVGRSQDVTYIDVGCLWPKKHSNSFFFYERGGSGLCIDPNPEVAAEFRAARPRDTFVNCGISDRRHEMTYHMYGNPVFNTFSPSVVEDLEREAARREGAQRDGRTLTRAVSVPVMTLDDAVRETDFASKVDGRVDFLSIDVEGHELEVLAGFSFELIRPRLIVAEHIRRGRDRRRPEELPIARTLEARGYWVVGYTGHDIYLLDERR